MYDLKELRQKVLRGDRAAFIAREPGLFLFVEVPGSDELGFKTRVASGSMPSIAEVVLRGESTKRETERLVMRVAKSDRNAWRSRISVGRATNNDLIIRHESVSKLHAHFQVVAEGAGERLVISDAGSVNGTLVNGRSAGEPPDDGVAVQPGDRILIGDVRCELLDAPRLYDRLSRMDQALDF